MPAILQPNRFTFVPGETVPDHLEETVFYRAEEANPWNYHIEVSVLERGETGYWAINLENPIDAATVFVAAIRHAKQSDPRDMTNMNGFAIVGPNFEGKYGSKLTTGIGFRLNLGHDLRQGAVAILFRVPEVAPKILPLLID